VDACANIKQQTWKVRPFQERSSINFGQIFDFSFSKETDASYWRRGDFFFFFQLYNSLWVLACSIISFHCFLSCVLCEEETYLNKLWKFGRTTVKTLCTYFQFNGIKCITYFQYNSVKIVSFSFYFPFSLIQLGSCSSQPLVSFCPFIVCFLLFYKTYL